MSAPADLVAAVKAAMLSVPLPDGTSILHDAQVTSDETDALVHSAVAAYQAYMASDGVVQVDQDAAQEWTGISFFDYEGDYEKDLTESFAVHRRAASTPQPDPRDAEIERLREALTEIANRHIGDQPAADGGTEADWAVRNHTALRSIACTALANPEGKA